MQKKREKKESEIINGFMIIRYQTQRPNLALKISLV